MEEYRKAKDQQLSDNAKFIEAVKILGMEATYFAGRYTVRNNGVYLDTMTASEWLVHFAAAFDQAKQERNQ